jgi:hypothetical protein
MRDRRETLMLSGPAKTIAIAHQWHLSPSANAGDRRLVNAIAWASQQAPDDPHLIDRLFAISLGTAR